MNTKFGFDGRVAIVTGAGNGLGRSHALSLAGRGAKVVVNDVGASRDGKGLISETARNVANEIKARGGVAIANSSDISDRNQVQEMVNQALSEWGRVDILVNNAGILRDKTFAKLEEPDFEAVLSVHLRGTVNCTKAVWQVMRDQNYGRVVMTSSASGLHGNFGQANYGAAKAAMVGLMNVLHLEGAKHNIRVNILAPTATTRMTEELLPEQASRLLTPESVSPAVLFLVSEDAPSRVILGAGAGVFAVTHIVESQGIYLSEMERTPEAIARRFAEIADFTTAAPLNSAFDQTMKFVGIAAAAQKVILS